MSVAVSEATVAALPTAAPAVNRRQLAYDIAIPFIATRLALLLVGWYARHFPAWSGYPLQDVLARGWQFSPYRLIDIWGRWDSGWYLNIVREGYVVRGDFLAQQSNIAFFPLYPYLVRALFALVPSQYQTDGMVLLIGVLLSNLFLLGALVLLYLLAFELTRDLAMAQRAVLYTLLFPTAFFYGAFYTEAAFLFFSVAALYAAQRRQWAWAGAAAALLGITRPQGILMLPVLLWMYFSAAQWRVQNIRLTVGWLLLAAIPFLLFLGWIGQMTGNFLAPMLAQQAYDRDFAMPWVTLFAPRSVGLMTTLEQALVLLAIVTGIVALWRLPTWGYGLWVFAVILPFLITGVLGGSVRFVLGASPMYLVLALWGARPAVDRLLQTLFLAMQVLLMVAWSQFYWVG